MQEIISDQTTQIPPPCFEGLKRRIFLYHWSWIRDCVNLPAKLHIFLHMRKREREILQDLVLQTFARDGGRGTRGARGMYYADYVLT